MHSLHRSEEAGILKTLETHLIAAATKNHTLFRSVFVPRGQFIGTDDCEIWTVDQLVKELEKSKSGWDMTKCAQRTACLVDRRDSERIAVFFEVLVHKKYGKMRGSGTLLRCDDNNWRILQYILSFSVPNEVVEKKNIMALLRP